MEYVLETNGLCKRYRDFTALNGLATHYGFLEGGQMVKQMRAEELEMRCRRCTRIEAASSKALARVLDRLGAEYRVVDDASVDVFTDVQATKLVTEALK